jgi:hypothetical protein
MIVGHRQAVPGTVSCRASVLGGDRPSVTRICCHDVLLTGVPAARQQTGGGWRSTAKSYIVLRLIRPSGKRIVRRLTVGPAPSVGVVVSHGSIGPRTRQALRYARDFLGGIDPLVVGFVRRFQAGHGLVAGGVIDRRTQEASAGRAVLVLNRGAGQGVCPVAGTAPAVRSAGQAALCTASADDCPLPGLRSRGFPHGRSRSRRFLHPCWTWLPGVIRTRRSRSGSSR